MTIVDLVIMLVVMFMTLLNAAILGMAIKLYTDQSKQSILRGLKK